MSAVLTQARLKLYINGIPFGIATEFGWQSSSGRRQLYGIDSVTPFELAPGGQSVTGNISCLRLTLDGGLEGRNIAAIDSRLTTEKYISILLLDKLTDTPVFWCPEAAVNSQRWSVNSRGILTGSFDFMGIGWENEAIASQG